VKKKKPIKVVKKIERELHQQLCEAKAIDTKTENQTRREIVGTIASWIEEKRELKLSDAFKKSSEFFAISKPESIA
jgi:hypothetical protein